MERHRNHHRHLAEDEVYGKEQARRRFRVHHEKHQVVDDRQEREVYRHHGKQAKVLAHDKRHSANRLRKQREHRAPLDFLLHQADTHEDGNQEALEISEARKKVVSSRVSFI